MQQLFNYTTAYIIVSDDKSHILKFNEPTDRRTSELVAAVRFMGISSGHHYHH